MGKGSKSGMSERRRKTKAAKKARKEAAMKNPGFKSKYALKRSEQAKGVYRPTSPFYGGPAVAGEEEG